MHINKRSIAATQLLLIFPATLFMAALLARHLQPLLYEPAHTAQLIVMWYSGRVWTLWVLLIDLPLAVLVLGCVTLLKDWIAYTKPQQVTPQPSAKVRLHPATIIIVAVTLAAGVILAVVAVHMLMN
jgi:hypothetical protein